MGTITDEAQQCRVAGGQESLAIKQSPQLRKVQNPAIQNAFKGSGERDRIENLYVEKIKYVPQLRCRHCHFPGVYVQTR